MVFCHNRSIARRKLYNIEELNTNQKVEKVAFIWRDFIFNTKI